MARHRVVIVGAGHAGGVAAMALRANVPDAEIVLLGAEEHPPYERPPISKGILAATSPVDGAYLRPIEAYAEMDIILRLSTRVEGIDCTAQRVSLAGGGELEYDQLLLTTGARPRRLPHAEDVDGVFYIRDIPDALALRGELQTGRRLVIIGGGFVGLEVASVARTNGCDVTVLEAAPRLLARVMPGEIAEYVCGLHRAHGVTVALDAVVDGLERGGKVYRVYVNGEELLADVVVVGIGAVPNVELAEAAGIIVSDGIVVDEFGRTSDPAVYAAGDVTFHYNPLLRRNLRLESWQNAQNQAFATAQTIAGSGRPYAELPWFWTDQYNCNLQIVGAPERWDAVVFRGDPTEGRFVAFILDAGRIVGGCTVNSARDMRLVKQLVLGERRFEPRTLRDTSKTLAEFVRAA